MGKIKKRISNFLKRRRSRVTLNIGSVNREELERRLLAAGVNDAVITQNATAAGYDVAVWRSDEAKANAVIREMDQQATPTDPLR
ncbi:hypothetical protein DL546_003858 [Coniochaeta pulveracea]|uniref:RRM domain-containing protein n=1 Tax=Coniochaeta pulveracea TaxID=177199 RepID=A0A420Y6I2_9PEZI|nr:hypothetical protein DL546_003858 [Coniochaeta pulveracea]